jgi:hypothetical protein
MWFGTNQGVLGLEAWSLFEDNQGDICFTAAGTELIGSVLQNNSITKLNKCDGLESGAVQFIYQDNLGKILCGGHFGLYRYDPSNNDADTKPFIYLTKSDYWK